jgi:hypothetical protein
VDITEFAPRSVRSDGDFEDILAADRPDVWVSHRPAKGGEAGEMLAKIIERAAALKAGGTPEPARAAKPAATPAARKRTGSRPTAATKKPTARPAKKPR